MIQLYPDRVLLAIGVMALAIVTLLVFLVFLELFIDYLYRRWK